MCIAPSKVPARLATSFTQTELPTGRTTADADPARGASALQRGAQYEVGETRLILECL